MTENMDLLTDLQARGLVAQTTDEEALARHLASGCCTLYSGFDPTADSLHIGHLVPLLALKRFQAAGHRPIALVGGATGMIGDPSFKAAERQLNSEEVVENWVERLASQIRRFLDFDCGPSSAVVVNNLDWMRDRTVLAFLRDIGKHFSVNAMIQKESVRQRLARDGSGISFTEFSYILLQSYDFAELYQRYGCTLQIGGSDQWGNITGGIDLTRRLHRGQVHGLTLPLVTKADGSKFGKTESGTVWLDPERTSPYAFYQFWLNTADDDVYKFLRYFTFLSPAEIDAIEEEDRHATGKPRAQGVLAREVTRLIHGDDGVAAAERISEALFSGDISRLGEADLAQLQLDGLPSTRFETHEPHIVEALVETGLARSKRAAREFLGSNAVHANGERINSEDFLLSREQAMFGRYWILRRGKKQFHLLYLAQ